MKRVLQKSITPFRLLVVLFPFTAAVSTATATDYYANATSGSSTHAGTSSVAAGQTFDEVPATTVRPEDRTLFKSGGSCTGRWQRKGNCSAGDPIIVDQYSTGANPFVNGTWEQSAVLLLNVSYLSAATLTDPGA